ncbi:unnamed protein product [Spirodela intermedia]|uniref:Uncharacterized protein n=1 Tax=Spirodela intermedia TaxID=51605 RepID=A0A7I8IXW4_SPIIN|nr:unnamed protein product [Spirodela intermedia]CAA6662688.1 unnamed protein product [Spirodela intermedia]
MSCAGSGSGARGTSECAFVRGVCAAAVKGNLRDLRNPGVASRFTPSVVTHVLLHLSRAGAGPSVPGPSSDGCSLSPDTATPSRPTGPWSVSLSGTGSSEPPGNSSGVSPPRTSSPPRIRGDENQRAPPDAHACSALLSSLVKAGLTATAWKMFDEMRSFFVVPNRHIFNVMIHACCRSGEPERAKALVGEMRRKGVPRTYGDEEQGVSPDVVTFNSLLHGLCREGRMKEAMRIFREMKGAEPNQVTFTTLIDGCCRAGDVDGAFALREEMEARGVPLCAAAYNAIIRKLCEQGKMRAANSLLNEMDGRKVEADCVTCNTLINAYCKKGDVGFAWKLRNKMVESGMALDQFTFKALIHGFCRVKQLDQAKEVLYEMIDAGFSPNYATYSWVVDGYCNKGEEEEVLKIPQELSERGFPAEKSLYRAIIRRLCKRRLVSCAERVFYLMRERGFHDDSLVCASLAYAYLAAGKPAAAEALLEAMAGKKMAITPKIYSSLAASHADGGGTLELLWSCAAEKGLLGTKVSMMIQQSKPSCVSLSNGRIHGPP